MGPDRLIDRPLQPPIAAIDVGGEEPRAAVGPEVFMLPDKRPDDAAIGFRERQGLDILGPMPRETPLAHVVRHNADRAEHAVIKEQPMASAFKGLLADEPQQVQAFKGNVDSGLFLDFALRTLGRRFTQRHVEFAPDRRAQALVGFLEASEQQNAALIITKVAKAR